MPTTPISLPRESPGDDARTGEVSDSGVWQRCVRLMREDYRVNGRTPGFHALATARIESLARSLPAVGARVAVPFTSLARIAIWLAHRVDLPGTATVGRRVRITGRDVAIHPHARIGDDCVIAAHVKLSSHSPDPHDRTGSAPTLGAGVRLGEGCCVIGPVTIGDNAVIGPYTTISTNVAAGARVHMHQAHGQVYLRLASSEHDPAAATRPTSCSASL